MSFDATTVSRFLSRDKLGHENDWHAVQHPVGCNLTRHFRAVGLRHDQIEKDQIGLEAARGFQCPPWIVHCARKVISGVFEKLLRTAREPGVVIYD